MCMCIRIRFKGKATLRVCVDIGTGDSRALRPCDLKNE